MTRKADLSEDRRACRISFRINACHKSLTELYESLVDRDFVVSEKEAKQVISELKLIIKSIKHDDF